MSIYTMRCCSLYYKVNQLARPVLYPNSKFVLSSTALKVLNVIRNLSDVRGSNEYKSDGDIHSAEIQNNISYNIADEVDGGNLIPSRCAQSPEGSKLLKAAIIGAPNVGKSTLINQIMGRRVFAISSKVHTTRCQARGTCVVGKTQLIFLDTPGLVTGYERRKYNLERSFTVDGEVSMQEADVLLIVHDVSNGDYSAKLEPRLLRLLHLYKDKKCVLVMNKVDCIKAKRTLLDLADVLTCGSSQKLRDTLKSEEWSPKTEFSVQKAIKNKKGWPFFDQVFMVSALAGTGVEDIKEYLLRCAKPSEWIFPRGAVTDQNYVKIIEDTIQAQLLDNLPNEVPYNLTTQMEYFDQKPEGTITTVVLVGCKTPRIEKLVMGRGGRRVSAVAKAAEQELQNTFRAPVRLRLVVTKQQAAERRVDAEEHGRNILEGAPALEA